MILPNKFKTIGIDITSLLRDVNHDHSKRRPANKNKAFDIIVIAAAKAQTNHIDSDESKSSRTDCENVTGEKE